MGEEWSEEEKPSTSTPRAFNRLLDLNAPAGFPEAEEYREEDGRDDGHDLSLREWLDRPGRPVVLHESMHIFRQVVDMVRASHDEGVVVGSIRPSCFVMSTFNKVSFIESASCSSSDSFDEDRGGGEKGACSDEVEEKKRMFPLKPILGMELNWYTSPEERAGSSGKFESDIYRLGILLFELICPFGSVVEKHSNMENLRHRVLPPQFLMNCPKEASFCLWMLHPQPSSRPKMIDVLSSEFLNEPGHGFEDREAAIKLNEDAENQELLLQFLLRLHSRKQETADRLKDALSYITTDIDEIVWQRKILSESGSYRDDVNKRSGQENDQFGRNYDAETSSSRKRYRQGLQTYPDEGASKHSSDNPSTDLPKNKGIIMCRTSQLIKNLKQLESTYFQTRFRMTQSARKVSSNYFVSNGHKGSFSKPGHNSLDYSVWGKREPCKGTGGLLNPFINGLSKYLSFSSMKVRADLKQTDLLNSSNLVCSLGFDRDRKMFATAGINRRIKIFECDMVLNEDRDIYYPVIEMVSRSKLSSICWNGYIKTRIASSDFEGAVQVWDITRNQASIEMREHEQRVWCVDFSLADPSKLASGSDDCTAKIWNTNQAGSTATIKTKAYVCSVQFHPKSCHSLAVGSADHKIYYYDLRNLSVPLCTLVGHSKTVSYVKFVDSSTLVSASTDNSLKLWDLSMNTSKIMDSPVQTFTGHTNVKNFVGLSIFDGYIATGSETNEVFVYHKTFPMPMLSFRFDDAGSAASVQEVDEGTPFISSVSWRGRSSILAAANSRGCIKLLEMV